MCCLPPAKLVLPDRNLHFHSLLYHSLKYASSKESSSFHLIFFLSLLKVISLQDLLIFSLDHGLHIHPFLPNTTASIRIRACNSFFRVFSEPPKRSVSGCLTLQCILKPQSRFQFSEIICSSLSS